MVLYMDVLKVDKRLDARTLGCSGPLIETIRILKNMDSGQTLEVLVADEKSVEDIPFWVRKTGNEILRIEKFDDYWRLVIRKC